MRFLAISTTLLLALTTLAPAAYAMHLPPIPEGYCTIDNNEDGDRRALPYMHLTMQHGADLKALFADCGDLQLVRKGRAEFLPRYAVLFQSKDTLPAGVAPTQAISTVAAALGLSGVTAAKAYNENAIMADINASGRPNLRSLNASTHAVLVERPNVIIFAGEQRHLGHRLTYAVAAVTAIAVVENKFITLNLYAPLESDDTYHKLSTLADSYIASLFAANKG